METRTSGANFVTRAEDGAKRIEGYFAVFGSNYEMWPGYTESVDPHAFDGAIEGEDIRCLIDHETRLVLGRTVAGTLTLRADDKGLWGSCLINEDDQDAMNLYARVERGDVSQCSFGFDILGEENDVDEKSGSVHTTITKVKLYEVSCVTFPAYTDTGIEARKARVGELKREQLKTWKAALLARLRK